MENRLWALNAYEMIRFLYKTEIQTKTLAIIFLLFVCLCALSLSVQAQSYKLITSGSGLSSSLVNRVWQDRYGMIWIATENGLNRYDGVKVNVYKGNSHVTGDLCDSFVSLLFEDKEGHLIVGTHKGLQLYDAATDQFSPLATWTDGTPLALNIVTIVQRQTGELLVSGSVFAKIKIQGNKLVAERCHWKYAADNTDDMVEDRQGNMWISITGKGICRLDRAGKTKLYPPTVFGMDVTKMFVTASGQIYMGTLNHGLWCYDPSADTFRLISDLRLKIKDIIEPSPGHLLIATDGNGVKAYTVGTNQLTDWSFSNVHFSPNTTKVHTLLRDAYGNIWLGLYQKGVLMVPRQFNRFGYMGHLTSGTNLIGNAAVTAITKDPAGVLWVGTDNDGLYLVAQNSTSQHLPLGRVPFTIMSLYTDLRGRVWVGSYTHGAGILNSSSGELTSIKLIDAKGNEAQRVYDFSEDAEGNIWIATMGNGIFVVNPSEKPHAWSGNGAVNPWVCCIHVMKSGQIWAGTYNGAYRCDRSAKRVKILLEGKIVFCLAEDGAGNVWLGCSDGLYKCDRKGKLTYYGTADGLADNAVFGIESDSNGSLWVSTSHGMSRLNTRTGKFTNYYASDGLQGNEFSKNASYKDLAGQLWFGGTDGITFFKPLEIMNPSRSWTVKTSAFYLAGQAINKATLSDGRAIIDTTVYDAKDFYLAYQDNTFTIEFTTLEKSSLERVCFRYSLGDADYIMLPKGENRVSFSNLSPGTYRFRVVAVDGDNESPEHVIYIHIAHPWWSSLWMRMVYVLMLLLGGWYLFRQFQARNKAKIEKLQQLHQQEISEARMKFFVNVSHDIRTPMTLIMSPLEKLIKTDGAAERQMLYHILYRNCQRILRLVNQLMDVRKIEKDEMRLTFRPIDIVAFLEDVYTSFTLRVEEDKISFSYSHDHIDKLECWVDPANFDKIIMNVLSNAFKFTPKGGHVDMYIREGHDGEEPYLSDYVEIVVEDDGADIPQEEREKIFECFYQAQNHIPGIGVGLNLTKSLVGLHHGAIWAASAVNYLHGARFIMRFPLGNDHLSAEQMAAPGIIEKSYESDHNIILHDNGGSVDQPHHRSAKMPFVLVVDDEADLRRYVALELSDVYNVIECENGREAWEKLFKYDIALVISDVMMPEVDGMDLCRKIKHNPNLLHIPVILLTAKIQNQDKIDGMEVGADSYITKPFDMSIVRSTANNLVTQRDMLRHAFTGQHFQEAKLTTPDVETHNDQLMNRIMKVINENISSSDLSVQFICEQVGISRAHLYRKLKEMTNQSASEFLRNVRLRQAAKMLEQKNYAITDVAYMTGFTSLSSFSAAFKELFSVAPSQYQCEKRKSGNNNTPYEV